MSEEKYPRRVWFGDACDEWGLSKPSYGNYMEYVSMEEHTSLLREAEERYKKEHYDRTRHWKRVLELEEKNRVLREALEIYSHLKPERNYAVKGAAEEEMVKALTENPELIAKGMGGALAREALAAAPSAQTNEEILERMERAKQDKDNLPKVPSGKATEQSKSSELTKQQDIEIERGCE